MSESSESPNGLVLPAGTERDTAADAPVQPEVVDDELATSAADGESVTRPTKLIRIASMIRTMLDEVRRAPIDEEGRKMLAEIHRRSLDQLEEVLSPELRSELEQVVLPLDSPVPTEGELRLAQAQLVGWLEGLFHGIQATLFTQQAVAQQQLEEMRQRRMLEGGTDQPAGGAYL